MDEDDFERISGKTRTESAELRRLSSERVPGRKSRFTQLAPTWLGFAALLIVVLALVMLTR
jgi:hypothetical protein